MARGIQLRWLSALATALVLGSGCLGYTSALGFRARRAVMENDIDAFEGLMEEAVDATPAGPLDNPELTVLTHFLDLAGDSKFFTYIDQWLASGWIGEDMTCAIYRARYRATAQSDPEEAERAAQVCITRARASAPIPERSWEVERCLEEAPFLVDTSTSSLVPYLKMVADPTEPLRFRYGLLDGMTRVYITGPERLYGNRQPEITRAEAAQIARGHAKAQAARIRWIVDAVRPYVEARFLASATARGTIEVENVAVSLGESFVGPYALSDVPYDRDLAWGWVRSIKTKKKIERVAGLGLWSRARELRQDVYWYLCSRAATVVDKDAPAALLGSIRLVDAVSIREKKPVEDMEALRKLNCSATADQPAHPHIAGPFPLEATARGTVTASIAATLPPEVRVSVSLKRRVLH